MVIRISNIELFIKNIIWDQNRISNNSKDQNVFLLKKSANNVNDTNYRYNVKIINIKYIVDIKIKKNIVD